MDVPPCSDDEEETRREVSRFARSDGFLVFGRAGRSKCGSRKGAKLAKETDRDLTGPELFVRAVPLIPRLGRD
jgi:hypothetical protein